MCVYGLGLGLGLVCLRVLGSTTAHARKKKKKHLVAVEEAVCNLLNALQWCRSVCSTALER